MASTVLVNPFFEWGGNDMSDAVTQAALEYRVELLDATTGGSGGTRGMVAGLKDWTVTLQLNMEYGAAALEAWLWDSVGDETAFVLRPSTGVAAPANPQYSANGLFEGFSPISGSIGEIITTPLVVRPASETNILQRATA